MLTRHRHVIFLSLNIKSIFCMFELFITDLQTIGLGIFSHNIVYPIKYWTTRVITDNEQSSKLSIKYTSMYIYLSPVSIVTKRIICIKICFNCVQNIACCRLQFITSLFPWRPIFLTNTTLSYVLPICILDTSRYVHVLQSRSRKCKFK